MKNEMRSEICFLIELCCFSQSVCVLINKRSFEHFICLDLILERYAP